ncbi:hypothetical protein GQ600_27278 [Phytophthora cactorum]|nr:hypothetical protein GQ600_27278 [Phytophthora cactorum]
MVLATGRAKPICSKRDQGANRAILEFITRETWPAQPINDSEVTFLSLQQVTVDRRALAQMNPLIPRSNWRFDEVSHRTTPYLVFCFDTYCPFLNVCTDNLDQESVSLYLQTIMHTGWVCSHVIASLDC